MPIYYVATPVRYVLVDAPDEAAARTAAVPLLEPLHAELAERIGREVPVAIRVVRLATPDEIEFWRGCEETLAREAASVRQRLS